MWDLVSELWDLAESTKSFEVKYAVAEQILRGEIVYSQDASCERLDVDKEGQFCSARTSSSIILAASKRD